MSKKKTRTRSAAVSRGLAVGLAAAAVATLAAALATARSTRAIRDRHPPQGRFIEIDGVRLHYLEAGSGPTVLLLHGNAVTAEDWRVSGLLDRLSQGARVIAPDRPGCGHSTRPRDRLWTAKAQAKIMAQLLLRLNAGPAVVVGHSLGVQSALHLALDAPQLVRGLVLISGYYFPSMRLDSLMVAPAASPGFGDVWRRTFAAPLGRALAGPTVKVLFTPQSVPQDYPQEPFEMVLRPLQVRAAAADGVYMVPEAGRLQHCLSQVRVPTAIIYGEQDKVVAPKAQSERAAERLPRAQLLKVPGGGHMVHHLATEAVAEATERVAA